MCMKIERVREIAFRLKHHLPTVGAKLFCSKIDVTELVKVRLCASMVIMIVILKIDLNIEIYTRKCR